MMWWQWVLTSFGAYAVVGLGILRFEFTREYPKRYADWKSKTDPFKPAKPKRPDYYEHDPYDRWRGKDPDKLATSDALGDAALPALFWPFIAVIGGLYGIFVWPVQTLIWPLAVKWFKRPAIKRAEAAS